MRALPLLLVAALLSGCTQGDGLARLTGADASHDPYYKEHRAILSGEHDESYDFPVDAGASLVNVTLVLDARTNGLPLPERAPAQLRLELMDAGDVLLSSATLDADHPVASLLAQAPSSAGAYTARVSGIGFSQAVDGDTYGAQYVLTIEVAYP